MSLALGPGAAARAAPPSPDPEATVVSEFVVTAHAGGPAWWRVSSARGTVWVLGVPEVLPHGLKWDQTLLRLRLKGARELIGGPAVTVSFGDIFALMRLRGQLRAHGRMEDGLAPDLRARFLADKARLTRDPRAYSGWSPLVASLLMAQDFRRESHLDTLEPARSITALARAEGVKVTPAGSYRLVPLLRGAESGMDAAGPECLADVLDEIEAGPDRARAAAQGWARGDTAMALTAARGYERCLNALPGSLNLSDRTAADAAAAIGKAADAGGESVAIINLRTLLAQTGALQRLRSAGYRIDTPN
ncbi:MAG: TraB/GumN family protein [Alphaproteobacteria bacterium]|nr:TraB/GumN family protein [Alphaproteobacteria bacterium]